MSRSCVVIGSGRAGGSFHQALADRGWSTELVRARPLVAVTEAPVPDVETAHLSTSDPSTSDPSTSNLSTSNLSTSDPSTSNLSTSGPGSSDLSASSPGASDLSAPDLSAADLRKADLVLLTVPDATIAHVARALPATDAVVAHVSGACGLDVLAPHRRVGSIHPLMSLPDAVTGSRRLLDSCTFAVDGDPLMAEVVASLRGRAIDVPASSRALYHATASIAANHLTALCAQVESLAEQVGVPVEAYWILMRTTLDNVADVGPAAALTGPAARADWDTIRTHLAALPTDDDRHLYLALCERAADLAGHDMAGWSDEAQP